MLQWLKAFIHDPVSWGLAAALLFTLAVCVSTLINRYDRVDVLRLRLYQLEYDLSVLSVEKQQKTQWLGRLEGDPASWEQVAREKMNYLGSDEVLINFTPQNEPR
ncbi:MAG: hypothetical protein P9L94_01335 [Candidatus Hinthialibacter antarcticus]|nr:hypothetical protein [Candidatus Hinthialibacter antarcticus]